MTLEIDLERYWGARFRGVAYDCAAMSVVFDLYWTDGSLSFGARLLFEGVTKLNFMAEKIYRSEVVELVSLEGRKETNGWRIVGELSNYDFDILCTGVKEIDSRTANT